MTDAAPPTDLVAKRADLLAKAAALLPALRERAAEAEALRQMPDATVRDLVDSGLLAIGTPARYGGWGGDYDLMFDVADLLGRACGSTAWCYSVWTVHNWWVGFFPQQAQDEYFADGPSTVASSAVQATGTAIPVPGGLRVSGRWSFSSGCDAGRWLFTQAVLPDGTDRWVLLPRSDYQIIDNWHVAGLRGTGSKDVTASDVFVPAHRTLDIKRAGDGDFTGWELHGRPSYRVPQRALSGWDLSAPLIGMALGAVDEFTARLRGRTGTGRTADNPALQLRLAEASAEVDIARMAHRATVAQILALDARTHPVSELDRARFLRTKAYIARLCVHAVDTLFAAGGARSLYDTDALQRFHRDVHAAAHHFSMDWDAHGGNYGHLALQ